MIVVISPNASKRRAMLTAAEVCRKLSEFDAEIRMDTQFSGDFPDSLPIRYLPADTLYASADFTIPIGGDGTILQCAGRLLSYAEKTGTPPCRLVGINTGTLGFLAAFEADELGMLARLFTGEYEISRRMLLKTRICGGTEDGTVRLALNDIYASRLNGKICDFTVSADGREISTYRADGIIFSTPTGSSAYALSAGGPVMEPDLMLTEMNLICPHSLFARPMLFSPQREICVTYRGAGDGGLNVHVDGTHTAVLHNHCSFTVTAAEQTMPFVDCKGHVFYDALNGKLMQPLKGVSQLHSSE